jgi:hypothetical protein
LFKLWSRKSIYNECWREKRVQTKKNTQLAKKILKTEEMALWKSRWMGQS